jgi:hypothetical protein
MLSAAGCGVLRSVRFGFLGPGLFCCENLQFCLLDSLGFPRILSSESSLFNGLRRIFRDDFFSTLFRYAGRAATGACGLGMHGIVHGAKLNLVSGFLQWIVAA